MSHIQIKRLDQNHMRTFGALSINGILACTTLELPWKNNEINISCIPIGNYNYKIYDSNKFNCLCIALYDVYKRSYVAVHYGFMAKHSKGCILVMPKIVSTLQESKTTLQNLIDIINPSGIITISNHF